MRAHGTTIWSLALAVLVVLGDAPARSAPPARSFSVGETDFLLDGQPFVIRSGEMHAARVPREYWRHRLQMIRALGCNTVCAYLFWNQHEPRPGEFDFSGQADAAEYCRIAGEVGLKVILRPGPYACAEWEFGGFPWWLLNSPGIALRTQHEAYLDAVRRYLNRVGQELAPLQVTRGGPIIMVQVENEYGSYGADREYIGLIRDMLVNAGFDVPLFTCDGPSQLKNNVRDDIFSVVNFGGDPEGAFKALREVRPKGPLMCGEYYPGWFDSWGKPHHTGDVAKVLSDLSYMLKNRASFSIYMAHGGTSFGFSSGANSPPFRPQSTSYDYDAPIDEAGRGTAKFHALRELFAAHLLPGETIPAPPPANPVITIPEIRLSQCAPLFENLGPSKRDLRPQPMEVYDQGQGLILYRRHIEAGPAAPLYIQDVHDLARVYVDGVLVGGVDRRSPSTFVHLPPNSERARLDILVEAFGRVNYGAEIHDRKGITDSVRLLREETGRGPLLAWEVFNLPLDQAYMASLRFEDRQPPVDQAAFHRASFELASVGDTFLDLSGWSRGMVWVNGRNLGRYWNIGPQQTLYVPGCWLKSGTNELVIFDAEGGVAERVIRGLDAPILNRLNLSPHGHRRHRSGGEALDLAGHRPVAEFEAANIGGHYWRGFDEARGRYLCIEALDSWLDDPFTTCAEVTVNGPVDITQSRPTWKVLYADSEETDGDSGSAANLLDGNEDTFWHTQWEAARPSHPHRVVIDLGREETLNVVYLLPRQDSANGRMRNVRVYLSRAPFAGLRSTVEPDLAKP